MNRKNWRTAVAFLIMGGSAAIASAQYGSRLQRFYHERVALTMPLIGAIRMASTTAATTAQPAIAFAPPTTAPTNMLRSTAIRRSAATSTRTSTVKPTSTDTRKATAASLLQWSFSLLRRPLFAHNIIATNTISAPPMTLQTSSIVLQIHSKSLLLFPVLEELGVDQKAEPECLQGPEDEPLPSIEEAQAKKVAVEEKGIRANEERCVVVEAAQIALALQRVSPEAEAGCALHPCAASAPSPRHRTSGYAAPSTLKATCGFHRSCSPGAGRRSPA